MYEFDPEHAKAELVRTDGMSSETAKRAAIARISTAAQIDIAESLRVIAQEAALAMFGADVEPDDTSDDAPEPDPLVVGDVVQVGGADGKTGTIQAFRFTEDEYFAEVEWADGSGGGAVAVSRLSRLVGDEGEKSDPLAEVVIDPIVPDPVVVAAELAGDIDDDFDGDEHPDAASALEILKANEAARKAAKKKGKKS